MTSTICALPGCKNPVSRSNQTYCCKAHRQLAYVREKRRQAPGWTPMPEKRRQAL